MNEAPEMRNGDSIRSWLVGLKLEVMTKEKDAKYWITHLKMTPHPEGGYFREEYRAKKSIYPEGKSCIR